MMFVPKGLDPRHVAPVASLVDVYPHASYYPLPYGPGSQMDSKRSRDFSILPFGLHTLLIPFGLTHAWVLVPNLCCRAICLHLFMPQPLPIHAASLAPEMESSHCRTCTNECPSTSIFSLETGKPLLQSLKNLYRLQD
jgi:hypothetical protein